MKLIVEKPENILNKVKSDFTRSVRRTKTESPIQRTVKKTINRGLRKDKARTLTQPELSSEKIDLIQEFILRSKTNQPETQEQKTHEITLKGQNSPLPDKADERKSENVNMNEKHPQEENMKKNCGEVSRGELLCQNEEAALSGDIYYSVNSPETESEIDFEPFPFKF
ncbi:unnamed protein product [Blepharisma stoltei]|uniref:Uncharacterized protein n=1 Tax=Blepharisma stoltei TaxID=1481888 RepID=A0AAU9KCV2_9CILI|nr:unnamed protein product [Blepharisma stoltei]